MAVSHQIHRSGRHVALQYLISHMLVILLLQIFTSEAFRLWSPQAYGTKEPRDSPTHQALKRFGVPDLAPYTKSQTEAQVKADTENKVLRQQKLIEEQHLLHAEMNGPKSLVRPHLASFMTSESQVHVKHDPDKEILMKQKLINEQHLLHLGMSSHPSSPPKRQESDLVPQIFPPSKKVNPLLHHDEFMKIVPEFAHEILLPTYQPPQSTSTSSSRICNSEPQTTTQNSSPNPEQTPTQNPEEWPLSPQEPPIDQPSIEEGSGKPETVTGPSDSGNRSAICYPSLNPGKCLGAFKRYYYNVTLDQCDCFFFGGCEDRASPVDRNTSTYLASLEQCLETCNPGKKLAGPRCATALRPSLFFLDPSDQDHKMEGAESPGTKDKIQNRQQLLKT